MLRRECRQGGVGGEECGTRVSERVKAQVHKAVLRPVIFYRLKVVMLGNRQEAELKLLVFSLGEQRMYKIRNKYIRGHSIGKAVQRHIDRQH